MFYIQIYIFCNLCCKKLKLKRFHFASLPGRERGRGESESEAKREFLMTFRSRKDAEIICLELSELLTAKCDKMLLEHLVIQ